MDILSGLAVAGQFINSRSEKERIDNNIEKMKSPKRKSSPTQNIFNNDKLKSVERDVREKAKIRMKKSQSPEKTGVIPKHYNRRRAENKKKKDMNFEHFGNLSDSDSVFSDGATRSPDASYRKSSCSSDRSSFNAANPRLFIDKAEKFLDNRKHERNFVQKVGDNNNFLSQFEPQKFDNAGLPSSSNAVHRGNGMDTVVDRMEAERELGLKGGFSNFGETVDGTYGVVNKDDFIHNNMKPNFKSKGLNNRSSEHAATIHQRKMESFSGSLNKDRPDWHHKQEQAPLFNPVVNLSNIYGSPVFTDFYEGRYIPGRERRNEKPFQETRVTPGLGLGAHENGQFARGTGDLYRVHRPNVDQLRPANRPKLSYSGVVVPGQKGYRGKVHGRQVAQKRGVSARIKENTMVDLQKTFTGQVHAPKMIGEVDPRRLGGVNRGKEEKYIGPAKHNINKVTNTELRDGTGEKYRTPFKQNFLQAEAPGVHLVEGAKTQAINYDTYIPDATQRGKEEKYIGPLGRSEVGKIQNYNLNDVPEPTMRNIHEKTDRSGKAIIGEHFKSIAFDPNDVPDITMRNIHEKTDRTGKAMTGDQYKSTVYDSNDVPDFNMRNIHEKTDRTGKAMTGDQHKSTAYDPNDVPDPTMRNIHDKYDRAGKAMDGDKQKGQYYDPNDVPDPTMRNIHDKYDRAGKAMDGDKQKGQYYDPNDVPDPTMRNIHDKYDRAGKAMDGDKQKGQYYDPNDVPDTTMRNIHDKYDRAGKAMDGDKQKGQYYDPNDVRDFNMRNIHDKYDRAGKAMDGDKFKSTTYNPNDVPDWNMRNVHDKYDRSGKAMTGEQYKSTTYDPNDVPDFNMRNVHDKYDRSGKAMTGEQYKSTTYDPNDVPDFNMRNVHDKYDRAGKAMDGDKQKGKYYDPNDVPDFNMRNVHEKYDRSGKAMTGDQYKSTAYDPNDVPEFNMRNVHEKYDRSGKAMTGDQYKSTAYDPNDVPDITMRGIHAETDRAGKAATGDRRKGKVYDPNDVPDVTMREIHSKTDRAGKAATGDRRKGKAYDPDDVPDVTMREIHSKTDRAGKAATGDRRKGKAYDPNDVPDVTMREIHSKTDRAGKAATGDRRKGKAYDPNDVPDVTMREIHSKTDRAGKAATGDRRKGKAYDPNDVPDVTMREIHAETDRAGKTVSGDKYRGKAIDYDDIPDITMREIHGETDRAGKGTITYTTRGPRNRADAYNSKVNVTKEIIAKGRAPTEVKQNLGPTTGFTNYRFRDPEQSEYLNHPKIPNQTTDNLPFRMENIKNPTWYINNRLTTYPDENLAKNPYINNIKHKAVIQFDNNKFTKNKVNKTNKKNERIKIEI